MTNVKTYALNSASSKQFDKIDWEVLPMAASKPAFDSHLVLGGFLTGQANMMLSKMKVPLNGPFSGHTYHVVITKARLSNSSSIPPSKNSGLKGDKRFHAERLVMSRNSWTSLVTYLKEATPSADIRLIAFVLRYGKLPESYVLTLRKDGRMVPEFYEFLYSLRYWIIAGAKRQTSPTNWHFNDNIKVYVNLATNAICYIELR